jgi:hypothetical protein
MYNLFTLYGSVADLDDFWPDPTLENVRGFLLHTHTKKVEIGSVIKDRIRIQIRPDPYPQHCITDSVMCHLHNEDNLFALLFFILSEKWISIDIF